MPIITRTTLTESAVKSAKPKASHYRLWDARVPGLCLRVLRTGTRTFEAHWSGGSAALGKYPVVTLEAARTQALAILSDAAANGTPAIAKSRAKVDTLADYIAVEYEPLVRANQEDGAGTIARIRSTFKPWLKKPMSDITDKMFENWRVKRINAGMAASTINRDMNALKACFSQAVKGKLLAANPLTDIKPLFVDNSPEPRYLLADENTRLRKALAARDDKMRAERASANAWRVERGYELLADVPADGFGDHLTPVVLLALNTGMRRGELLKLKWSDIDMETLHQVTVRGKPPRRGTGEKGTKSGKTRYIPLNAEARDVLTRWRRQVPDGRLFAVKAVTTAWRALLADAQIVDFRFHDLRHDFASKLVGKHVDLNVVRELLGHADIKMTLRYAHNDPAHKAAAVELLGVAR